MTVTADTITDDQLRELRIDVIAERERIIARSQRGAAGLYEAVLKLDWIQAQATIALGEKRARRDWSRAQARAACADIWNTRHTALSRDHKRGPQ